MKIIRLLFAVMVMLSYTNAFSQKCNKNSFELSENQIKRINKKTSVTIKDKYCVLETNENNVDTNCIIEGTIYDRLTRKPIESVGIYISEKCGAISNENGVFSLEVPAGKHKVNFSMVGYSNMQTKSITIKDHGKINLIVFLGPDFIR